MNSRFYSAVALSNDVLINKPFKVLFGNTAIVLVRTKESLHAYEDFCPHRGLALSEGVIFEDQIHCKYHGWRFNCENGQNTFVPVKNESISCKLKSVFVKDLYNLVWLSHDIDAILPLVSPYNPSILLQGNIKASLLNTLENFLEGSHTHFVHDGLVRSQNKIRNPIIAKLINNETGFTVTYDSEPAKGLLTNLLPKRLRKLYAVSTYIHPGIAILEYFNIEQKLVSRFEAILVENSEGVTYFARIFINLGWITPFIIPFAKQIFRKIIKQDQIVLELQKQNLEAFKNNSFNSDETDMVGKYIYAWINNKGSQLSKEETFTVYW